MSAFAVLAGGCADRSRGGALRRPRRSAATVRGAGDRVPRAAAVTAPRRASRTLDRAGVRAVEPHARGHELSLDRHRGGAASLDRAAGDLSDDVRGWPSAAPIAGGVRGQYAGGPASGRAARACSCSRGVRAPLGAARHCCTWAGSAHRAQLSRQSWREDRPDASRLTEFYVWVSLGGMARRTCLNTLVAPVMFRTVCTSIRSS